MPGDTICIVHDRFISTVGERRGACLSLLTWQSAVAMAKETARKVITEEMAAQMKALSEDKEKWVAKSIAGEQQAKKLNEGIAALQRQVEQLQDQVGGLGMHF